MEQIKVGEVWRHVKTGREYEILEIGKLQTKNDLDMAECVIYKNLKDGQVWVRPVEDFLEILDGGKPRFTKIR